MHDLKDPRIIVVKEVLLEFIHGKGSLRSIAPRYSGMTMLPLYRVWYLFYDNHLTSQLLQLNFTHLSIDVFTRHRPDLSKDIENLIFETAIYFSNTGKPLTRIDTLNLVQLILRRLTPSEQAQVIF